MSLCINPQCANPQNGDNILFCQACGSELQLKGQYRVIRQLGEGGFGKIFEVNQNNFLKVLKVLMLDDPKAVSLFQQEATVLSQLNHPGIPKAEEYFTFLPRNNQLLLHCLVMEKIEGLNLYQYMEQRENRPIDDKLAILWLTQLANILYEVHKQSFFHRDIKPSNIMLKADGHLVLIDFGTAREITQTYYQKAAGQNITGIISPGYTPLEQANGKAVPQSDFFALGRTFIYLLTGKSPDKFSENPQTGKLLWRDSASQVSKPLAGLIDYLMEPFSGKRPQNAEMILRCISDINNSSYLSSTSASAVPSTLVKPPQQSTQNKIISIYEQQSSKTKNNKFSNHAAEFLGTVVGITILILVKFGSRGLFQSNPNQPVATPTPTEIQANNPESINDEASNQAPSVSNETTSPEIPYGWKKFEGGGAGLWLPANWQTGDITEKLYEFMNNSGSHNPQIEEFVQLVKQNPSNFPIWAFDSNNAYSQSFNLVIVLHEKLSPQVNLELYMRDISTDGTVLDMKTYSIKGRQVGRMIVLGVNSKQLYYVIRDNDTVWTVMFSCKKEQFEQNFPVFQASISTFVF